MDFIPAFSILLSAVKIPIHLLTEVLVCFSKKDFSTAILEKKKAPNKLQVEDSKQDDNSIVEMTAAKMDELKIFKGDTVILRGKFASSIDAWKMTKPTSISLILAHKKPRDAPGLM